MSFLKIKDPLKREETVLEYLATMKRIRDNQLAERTGDIELQTDLSKFFRPITETQKASTKEITEGLKPIKERIEQLPKEFHQQLKPGEDYEELTKIDKIYNKMLSFNKGQMDETFGIEKIGDYYYIGDKMVDYDGDNIIIDGEKYPSTDGLWKLITSKNPPSREEYNVNDEVEYDKILKATNVMYRGNDPNNSHPKSNRGEKWKNLIEPLWRSVKKNKPPFIESPFKPSAYSLKPRSRSESESSNKSSGKGLRKNKKTTIVIPSDPNALLERLDLLMASKEAGHTGVRNELVSICDELKRQRVLNTKTYKKLMSII